MSWSVLWYIPDKDQIIKKWCNTDLNEAVRIYTLAKSAGKQLVTLRCDNVGFPPPERFQEVRLIEQGTGKDRKWVRTLVIMEQANRKGIFWCPYCREFRRFQRQTSFFSQGRWVPEPDRRGGLYCGMCGISHRDSHVRRWNPIAAKHYDSRRRTRGSN